MADVTEILSRIDRGDAKATDELLPLVYEELRRLASAKLVQEKPGQTLQGTALVHEAYLRLVGKAPASEAGRADSLAMEANGGVASWNSRGHFFAAAAEAMRRILIDHARKKKADKRGGACQRVVLAEVVAPESLLPAELLALDDALHQLAREFPTHAKLVNLRFIAGLTLQEAAASLDISLATAKRHWAFARAWLFGQLAEVSHEPR